MIRGLGEKVSLAITMTLRWLERDDMLRKEGGVGDVGGVDIVLKG